MNSEETYQIFKLILKEQKTKIDKFPVSDLNLMTFKLALELNNPRFMN